MPKVPEDRKKGKILCSPLIWGRGKWPSLQFAQYALVATSLDGLEFSPKDSTL